MTDTASALPVEERQEVDPNALGIALALSGAALGIIAAWLPVRDPESYRRAHPGEPVNEEVLVQSLPGLLLVGAAIACALSVFLAFRGRRAASGPVIAGSATIFLAIPAGARLLLEAHFGAAHGTPGPGLGVYAGLVGGLLMLVGGLLILRLPRIQTLVAASAASVLVAASAWWLAGMSEPAAPEGIATPSGFYQWPAHEVDSQEYFRAAYETCAAQSVDRLARVFLEAHGWKVKTTPEAVATAYARVSPEPAPVHDGCLAGFREKR
jgi:hypothetical protein